VRHDLRSMPHDRRFWRRVAAVAERSDLTHSYVAARHGVSVAALRRGSTGCAESKGIGDQTAAPAAGADHDVAAGTSGCAGCCLAR